MSLSEQFWLAKPRNSNVEYGLEANWYADGYSNVTCNISYNYLGGLTVAQSTILETAVIKEGLVSRDGFFKRQLLGQQIVAFGGNEVSSFDSPYEQGMSLIVSGDASITKTLDVNMSIRTKEIYTGELNSYFALLKYDTYIAPIADTILFSYPESRIANQLGDLIYEYGSNSSGLIKYNNIEYPLSNIGGTHKFYGIDTTSSNTFYSGTGGCVASNVELYYHASNIFVDGNTLIHDGNLGSFSGNIKYTALADKPDYTYTFNNIANNQYVSAVSAVANTPATSAGNMNITLTFVGNASKYYYTLTINDVAIAELNTTTKTAVYNRTYASGTYVVSVVVRTDGTGAGSSITVPNVLTFTIGPTDSIAAPYVTVTSSSVYVSGSTISISGINYNTSGSTLTFPTGSLNFYNVKNTIEPVSTNTFLTLNSKTGSSSFSYVTALTTPLTLNMSNRQALSVTLSGSGTYQAISTTVRNITSTVSAGLLSGINYVESAFTEPSFYCDFATVPVSSVARTGSTGVYYNPYNDTFYSHPNFDRGLYSPTISGLASGGQFVISVQSSGPLTTFVLNFSAETISACTVQWAGGTIYDAKALYTAGGCASSTYSSGNRFPIRCPITRTSLETIVVRFTFANTFTKLYITN